MKENTMNKENKNKIETLKKMLESEQKVFDAFCRQLAWISHVVRSDYDPNNPEHVKIGNEFKANVNKQIKRLLTFDLDKELYKLFDFLDEKQRKNKEKKP
jgi:hypothetical protein